ncbi:MAG TPA: hypothetical protein P5279_04825 [Anaerohalosphaeraceae bacterium]|jgi:hypothetical protein|nr:hypothetical protein [Anaerohalosphaeraceae bacterium]HRT49794.1 hypothetical protein [Anaerohalosphaeraceae bacterium]HRT85546.1 hypothetical protein [Anaerohalosphaeraceae bacterium]
MRAPLEAYFSFSEAEIAACRRRGFDPEADKAARMRLLEIVPETTPECCDDSFIDTHENAVEVYRLLDRSERWEIIRVRREVFAPGADTLGFDVGYWNSDHTSLIADSAVTPMWHPPAPEDWAETAEKLAGLNERLLFDGPAAAAEFLAWYRTKEWAETEGFEMEFGVVQVDAVRGGKK